MKNISDQVQKIYEKYNNACREDFHIFFRDGHTKELGCVLWERAIQYLADHKIPPTVGTMTAVAVSFIKIATFLMHGKITDPAGFCREMVDDSCGKLDVYKREGQS